MGNQVKLGNRKNRKNFMIQFRHVYRWSSQSAELLPSLAREKCRGVHPRLRRGTALSYQKRWAGVISVGLMKAVAAGAMRAEGADLATMMLEPEPALADVLSAQ